MQIVLKILFIFILISYAVNLIKLLENSNVDCAGIVDGNSLKDKCGVCDDDPTNNCEPDCAEFGVVAIYVAVQTVHQLIIIQMLHLMMEVVTHP